MGQIILMQGYTLRIICWILPKITVVHNHVLLSRQYALKQIILNTKSNTKESVLKEARYRNYVYRIKNWRYKRHLWLFLHDCICQIDFCFTLSYAYHT